MSKTSIELVRHALNGPTMGTRWTALFFAEQGFDPEPVRAALQASVDEIDAQMSGWRPESDLNRINAAPVGEWVSAPAHLLAVIGLGLEVGRASGGAFDIGMGDAVSAWGFGPLAADAARVQEAMNARRKPAHQLLELNEGMIRKRGAITLDLNGIAKGYGVDRLAETLKGFGIASALLGIDGEMRAIGLRPDGEAWTIAVEAPDPERRATHSILNLEDAAVATSGDYRHWVNVNGRRLSHTMDPRRGAPLTKSPASVTVVARTCAEADAWATALTVLGPDDGGAVALAQGLDALMLVRNGRDEIEPRPIGRLFWTPGTSS